MGKIISFATIKSELSKAVRYIGSYYCGTYKKALVFMFCNNRYVVIVESERGKTSTSFTNLGHAIMYYNELIEAE